MKLKLISVLFLCMCLCSACSNHETSEVTENNHQPVTEQTPETTAIQTADETLATETDTSAADSSATDETEKQSVEAVYHDMYGTSENKPYHVLENSEIVEYENELEFLLHRAEMLPERYLGHISDEQDLTDKARNVFIDIAGEEYIAHAEADYVEVDGVRMSLERRYSPYGVKYYEEYDIWFIVPNPPSGTREDGEDVIVIWDFPPYLMIRGKDGKILAAFY